MNNYSILFRFSWILLAVLTLSCDANRQTEVETTSLANDSQTNEPLDRKIQGIVYNTNDMQPVSGVSITTSTRSGISYTTTDGTFQIASLNDNATTYTVRAAKLGYLPTEVVVSDSKNTIEIPLSNALVPIETNQESINLTSDRNTATFFVGSAYTHETITISSNTNWLTITPSSVDIVNSENARITLSVDRDQIDERSTGTITISTTAGDFATVLATVDPYSNEEADDSTTTLPESSSLSPTPQQADCRRPDIFRVSNNDQALPLVVFPNTKTVPGNTGIYTAKQLAFLPYTDSFFMHRAGTLEIKHIGGGGSEVTLATAFEIDMNNVVNIVAQDTPETANARSEISVNLQPGIYCYLLRPLDGAFSATTELEFSLGFTPSQPF